SCDSLTPRMPAQPITGGLRTRRTTVTPTEIKALVERGSMFVGSGDFAKARRLYARAAKAGDPQAAIYLGETYDPAFLKRARCLWALAGDCQRARSSVINNRCAVITRRCRNCFCRNPSGPDSGALAVHLGAVKTLL